MMTLTQYKKVIKSLTRDELEAHLFEMLLAPGDRDHILSGVFNQFLSALTEPVE